MKTIITSLIILACVYFTFAQENDNCADAIALAVGNICTTSVYTNSSATAEAETVAQNPSCGLYKGADVWFTAVMPASGALRIETDNLGGSTPHSISVYSGTCSNFTEVLCMRQDKQRTFLEPTLAGQTLYIRVFSFNGIAGSSFELCVWEPKIPVNDNCASAIDLNAGESCVVGIYTNAYATSQPTDIAANPSCGAYRGGDVWFKTVVPTTGKLRIETNNLSDATSKSVSVYTGSCGTFTEAFCNQLDDKESFFDPGWAGQTVYIRIFSFDTEEGGDFELCVSNPSEPFNDDCSKAVALTVEENCNLDVFTNALATSEPLAVAPDPSCGNYRGGDVWFKTVMPTSGNLSFVTHNLAGANAHTVTIYKGSCNSMTEVFCNQLEGNGLFHDQNLAGETLYIRMYSYASEEGKPFDICVSDDPCLDVEASVIQTGLTLTATNPNAAYQWVDCNQGNDPIVGETEQSFTAGSEGAYAVMITENTCTVISDCYEMNIVGIKEEEGPEMKIFPNPVSGLLHVDLGNSDQQANFELINTTGQRIVTGNFSESTMIQLDMSPWSPGVYILKINTEKSVAIARLIKE